MLDDVFTRGVRCAEQVVKWQPTYPKLERKGLTIICLSYSMAFRYRTEQDNGLRSHTFTLH